ncbi:hypothetical protein K6119_17655 [Paracrocinitomix mangrovi]|uniref:hypothetical protein n=1 Tax=Paracrocinitomix mangrovi TaxID=2862509 RepID=UPI001C8DCA64|nr:hypothetical protein [Paracrocinitomix mangrovi]UKN01552.1 hypothetical protein K6119_17655 [Paracrocinitomix mangrovi]
MQKDARLKFNCPIDIHSMPKCKGGFHCTQCDKKVFDYSKMNLDSFDKSSEENKEISSCGVYQSYQLDGVFGDWRDKVNRYYRKTKRNAKSSRFSKTVVPFISLFVFMVGCANKHVCGNMWEKAPRSDRKMYKAYYESLERDTLRSNSNGQDHY